MKVQRLGVETIKEYNTPKKNGNTFAWFNKLSYCKNVLRYSPSFTKEEGKESRDKEPQR